MLNSIGKQFKAWALLAYLVLLPMVGMATVISVEGELSYTGTLSNHFEKSFRVSVNDCLWTVSTWKRGDPAGKTISSAFYDGTNVYRITQFGDDPKIKLTRQKDGKFDFTPLGGDAHAAPRNKGAVTVIPGRIPDYDASFIAPLWLMFCSECVFGSTGGEINSKPMWITDSSRSNEIAWAKWDKGSENSHYPSRFEFRRDSNAVYKVVFQILEFKKEGESTYPLFAKLTQFATNPKAQSEADLKVLTVTEIKTTKFAIEPVFAAAEIPSNSIVTDKRIAIATNSEHPLYLSYMASNKIASVQQATQMLVYKAVASDLARKADGEGHRSIRYLTVSFMGLVTFGLIYLTCSRKHKSSSSNNNKK